MNYYIYGYTDAGNCRSHNEDAVLVDHEVITDGSSEATVSAPFITAVCDGVGGENAGELAAKLCLQHLSVLDYSSNVDMRQKLLNIHGKIKRQGVNAENAVNMQTTLCALAMDENGRGLCVNIGDSRMYRYVNGTIRQISIDQSYGQFLYEHGRIDGMEELEPEYRNAIISSLGSTTNDPEIVQTPIINEFGAEPDDMILIVSDGISDFVTEDEFEIGLSMDLPISEKLVAIAKLALMNGSTDNISIVGVKPYIDDEELAALTFKETVGETVNITEVLAETESLGDILSINVEEIIGSEKAPERHDPVKKEELDLEAHDLFMQAQASLNRLSQLFNNDDNK